MKKVYEVMGKLNELGFEESVIKEYDSIITLVLEKSGFLVELDIEENSFALSYTSEDSNFEEIDCFHGSLEYVVSMFEQKTNEKGAK